MMDGNAEIVRLKFIEGPRKGEAQFKITSWPPPEELLPNKDGVYVREMYSQLPAEVATHPNLLRGAVYRWERKSEV